MRRLLRSLAFALMMAVVGAPAAVEAGCSASRIDVGTPPMIFGSRVLIGWRVVPDCDVIETGLLVGTDAANLVSIDPPVYGSRPEYRREITVGQTGAYWIAAYVVDEDGAISHSPKRVVFVAVPPPGLLPHGSHGVPPSYTGTDEDFLVQAGKPHFASMRRLEMNTLQLFTEAPFGAFAPFTGGTGHWLGSTNRGEVSDGQGTPLSLAGSTFTASSGDIQAVFDTIDANFAAFNFPRPGFSVVICSVGAARGVYTPLTCDTDSRAFRTDQGGIALSYREGLSQEFTIFRQFEGTLRNRASVTYFIPRAEPGQQLLSARLVAPMLAFTDTTQISLGGKNPIAIPFTCVGVGFCSGLATWDFTPEAAALASSAGGLLTLQVGPVPPGVDITDTSFGFFRQLDAVFNILLDIDYPWSHGGQIGGLTLTFQQTCPKQLTVMASPGTVRPVIPPGNTMPNAVAVAPTSATVDVFVQTCPPGNQAPATVDVALDVQAPSAGTPDAAGHLHDSRPANAKGVLQQGASTVTGCTAVVDGQGTGRCSVTYQPSQASGVETIIASAAGFPNATAQIRVEVPGLMNLAEVFTNFFRPTGQTTLHPDNHWGALNTLDNIQLVAFDFFEMFGATLGINDMSLRQGGLFDICGTWNPKDTCTIIRLDGTTAKIKKGHSGHRSGTSLDVDRSACFDPDLLGGCGKFDVSQRAFELLCNFRGGTRAPEESFHCEF